MALARYGDDADIHRPKVRFSLSADRPLREDLWFRISGERHTKLLECARVAQVTVQSSSSSAAGGCSPLARAITSDDLWRENWAVMITLLGARVGHPLAYLQ